MKTTDGGYTATCKVTVKPVAVTEVRLDQISLTMKVGDMLVLNATVLPENVTDKTVTWSSSNPAAESNFQGGFLVKMRFSSNNTL